jgi:hypothetical protein
MYNIYIFFRDQPQNCVVATSEFSYVWVNLFNKKQVHSKENQIRCYAILQGVPGYALFNRPTWIALHIELARVSCQIARAQLHRAISSYVRVYAFR